MNSNTDFGKKLRDFISNNLGYFVAFGISAIYILTALLEIVDTGKTVGQILADGLISFILGVSLNLVFSLQGVLNGNKNDKVIATTQEHGRVLEKCAPYLHLLPRWCEEKNDLELKNRRSHILQSESLRYDDYFSESGVTPYKPDQTRLNDKYLRSFERKRMKAFKKAVRARPAKLYPDALTTEMEQSKDRYDFGESKTQHMRSMTIHGITGRIFTAIIFGYFSIQQIADFSVTLLLWNAMQIGVHLINATIQMYKSYLFTVEEWRGNVVKKINNLEMFYNEIKEEQTNEQCTR